jgi:hypothetical protein
VPFHNGLLKRVAQDSAVRHGQEERKKFIVRCLLSLRMLLCRRLIYTFFIG